MQAAVIYGAGGLGCQVHDFLQQAGRYRPVAFLDSNPRKHGTLVGGLSVLGGLEQVVPLLASGVTRAVVAIGDNAARVALAEVLREQGMELISAIHPLASIALSAKLGPHVIIGPRANICVHAQLGEHVVMLAGAIAEHDNRIGRGAFLGPAVRLAGTVSIGDLASVAIGATIIHGRTVGPKAQVAPGAVVVRDVLPETIVSGVPAVATQAGRSHFVPEDGVSAAAVTADAID